MNEIQIPKKLEPIVRAFYADSAKTAKGLIIQAAKAIYGANDEEVLDYPFSRKHDITPEELEGICALIQGIKPQDALEALFAAQIVASHMLGMRKLAKNNRDDQRIGLKMLQFSNEAISRLQKKRAGGIQNITVSYNYSGTGTQLPINSGLQKEDYAS